MSVYNIIIGIFAQKRVFIIYLDTYLRSKSIIILCLLLNLFYTPCAYTRLLFNLIRLVFRVIVFNIYYIPITY